MKGRATYLDSSALVKLVVPEPESVALRRYVRRREPLVTSALSRTEVARALLPLGVAAVDRGMQMLSLIEVIRINDRILGTAGTLLPEELRSLDAIHIATAQLLGEDLARIVSYDERMLEAAAVLGLPVAAPS